MQFARLYNIYEFLYDFVVFTENICGRNINLVFYNDGDIHTLHGKNVYII